MTRRVVVVGHGMAGSRFVQELRAIAPDTHITVFGDEPGLPYNRVLLTEVLSGLCAPDDISLGEPAEVDVRSGVKVLAVDRARREVTAADGTLASYDALVLATGSAPLMPRIPGLSGADGALLPGIVPFRTLADCHQILAAARHARRAVVLGGGLLGLEAARGLVARGVATEVVHAAPHLMDRQLDPAAGRVLRRTLDRLGIGCRVGAVATGVLGIQRFRGLSFDDGSTIAADLLVLACGVRPDVSLARAMGLTVNQGVVVDGALRSVDDPAVYAIGDCAEHDGRVYGLVGPAWEQAAVAAAAIAVTGARYTGSRLVTRLKVSNVDLAAMGDTQAGEDDDAEIVHFADPTRGTYKKLVIRDDRLVGAILLGDVATAGLVTQLYDRGAPVPADRLALLFAGIGPSTSDPAQLPDRATVCTCNAVTKGAIAACVLAGARTVADVATGTRATTGCGSCRSTVAELVANLSTVDRAPESATA